MKLKKIMSVLLCAAMTLSFAGCGSENEEVVTQGDSRYEKVTLKLSCTGTEIGNDTIAAMLFAELMNERSGGNIKVNVFPNDQLGSGNQQKGLEQLLNGTVELDIHSTSIVAALDNTLMVSTLPWIFDDYQEAEDYFFGTGGEYVNSVLQTKGLRYLGATHNGFKAMTTSKNPIQSPEDLEGMKMRIPGGDFFAALYDTLGASPQALPWAEVFTALQQNTIDGHDNSLSTIDSANIQEVQKYISISNHTYEAFNFMANEEKFSELSEATQELIYECAEEACRVVNQQTIETEKLLKEQFVNEFGCEIYEFTPEDIEEFKVVVNPLIEEYKAIYGEEACSAFGL
ncbi:hypothetical protein AN639_12175 [Candidatus Epulonipiscium fishelsonii]|nr:hypothetical protein AN639_12175 [Epulopiscium sp. SCG-B05WGA-EpuloA1]